MEKIYERMIINILEDELHTLLKQLPPPRPEEIEPLPISQERLNKAIQKWTKALKTIAEKHPEITAKK